MIQKILYGLLATVIVMGHSNSVSMAMEKETDEKMPLQISYSNNDPLNEENINNPHRSYLSIQMPYANNDLFQQKKKYDKNKTSYAIGKALSCALDFCCYAPKNEVTYALPLFPGCVVAGFLDGIPGLVSFCHPVSSSVFIYGGVISGVCAAIGPTWFICGSIAACCTICCHEKYNACETCVAPLYHLKYKENIKEKLKLFQQKLEEWDNKPLYEDDSEKMSEIFAIYSQNEYEIPIQWSRDTDNGYFLEPLEEYLCYEFAKEKTVVDKLSLDFFNHPNTYQLQYRDYLDQELKKLKEAINAWNTYKTSPEEKKTDVIDAFCFYVENQYKIKFSWNENDSMKPLKIKLYEAFDSKKTSMVVEDLFNNFYYDKNMEDLRPKGNDFDPFSFFQNKKISLLTKN